MQSNRLIWVGAAIGSTIGGYAPALWGGDVFSMSSLLLGSVGAIAGIWVMFTMTRQ